jgi:phenol hydroxylase P2 protein
VYSPGLVKIDAPNRLVVKRETIEEIIGRKYDLQELQINLVTLSGNLDEDDDEFVLSWKH